MINYVPTRLQDQSSRVTKSKERFKKRPTSPQFFVPWKLKMQLRQALHFFQLISRSNLKPTVVTFNAIISAFEKGGQWQYALKLGKTNHIVFFVNVDWNGATYPQPILVKRMVLKWFIHQDSRFSKKISWHEGGINEKWGKSQLRWWLKSHKKPEVILDGGIFALSTRLAARFLWLLVCVFFFFSLLVCGGCFDAFLTAVFLCFLLLSPWSGDFSAPEMKMRSC